jgi:hypothetical protein
MASNKKIPIADIRSKDSRLSIPRNPETVKLPEEQNLVKDSAARFRITTDIPSSADTSLAALISANPRLAALISADPSLAALISANPSLAALISANPNLVDRLLSDRDRQIPRSKTPQETFESSRIGPLLDGSLSTDPSLSSSDLDLSDPKYGDSFDKDSRRRQPPPVSFNTARFSGNNAGQIPLAPGVGNLPKAWQDLPKNFQDQLRRLLPIYYDITGPNSNLVDRDPFVPPNLFEDGEPNPNTEDFLSDRNEFIDFSQIELPNRSNTNFLNLLLSLFNLVLSLSADDIKGDDYEVVVFTKIGDDEQRGERSDSEWQATIREKEREVSGINLGGRDLGDFTVGDPFPVQGSEVSVQEIEVEELEIAGEGKIEVAVKVILSNGEEILKAEPKDE